MQSTLEKLQDQLFFVTYIMFSHQLHVCINIDCESDAPVTGVGVWIREVERRRKRQMILKMLTIQSNVQDDSKYIFCFEPTSSMVYTLLLTENEQHCLTNNIVDEEPVL